jgi:serine/threonine-protein kinase
MRAGLAAMRVFDQEGNQLLAIREFNAVLQHNPAHAAAASGLAMMYTMRYRGSGRDITWLQRADASAQLALKLDDQLALAHVARAWVLEFQGKPELAMQATETALRLDPSNIYGLYGKARQLGGNKHYAEADAVMAQALRLYPKERLLHALAGALRYLQRDYAGAESIFRHCIQMEPDAASSYNDLSATLTALGRGDEALQVLQQGLQIHPNWELYTNLGNALFERADYIGAAKAFEYAVSPDKGNPNNFIAWANLADTQRWIPTQVAASRQSYQRAIALLAPLMAHSPDNVAYVSRAALYEARAGNKAAAAQHMRRALALAPAASEVHYRAAITAELGGDRAQALALLTRALALGYPLNPIDTEADLMDLRRDSRYQHLLMESARKK